jgi:hypothetical protein
MSNYMLIVYFSQLLFVCDELSYAPILSSCNLIISPYNMVNLLIFVALHENALQCNVKIFMKQGGYFRLVLLVTLIYVS